MALTKVIGDGLGAIPAISGASLTSLTSSQVDSGATTAKAWVNFNGTGTVAINDDYNVSSITDNGTGDYSVNFETNMSNTSYAVTGSTIGSGGYYSTFTCGGSVSTSATRIYIQHINNSRYDNSRVSLIVMGGQA